MLFLFNIKKSWNLKYPNGTSGSNITCLFWSEENFSRNATRKSMCTSPCALYSKELPTFDENVVLYENTGKYLDLTLDVKLSWKQFFRLRKKYGLQKTWIDIQFYHLWSTLFLYQSPETSMDLSYSTLRVVLVKITQTSQTILQGIVNALWYIQKDLKVETSDIKKFTINIIVELY